MRPTSTTAQSTRQRSSRGTGTLARGPASASSSQASSVHAVTQPSPIYGSPAAAADDPFEAAAAADVDFERTIDAEELQTIIDEAALQGGRFAQAPEELRNVVLVLAGHNQAMREQAKKIRKDRVAVEEEEAAARRRKQRDEESMREPVTPSASRQSTLQRGQSTGGFYARHPSLGARTGVSSVGGGGGGINGAVRRTDSRATADTWRSRGAMQSNVFVPAESLARSGTHTAFSPSARAVPTMARGKAREPPKHSLQWVKVHRRERVNEAWAVLRSLETSAAVLKDSLEPLWCYPPGDIDRSDAPDTDLDLQGQVGLLTEVRGYIATAKDAMLEFMGEGFTQSEKRTIGGNVHRMQSRRQKATTFQYIPSRTLDRPENLDERYNMKHDVEPASFYDPVARREVDSEGFPVEDEEEQEDDEEFTVDDNDDDDNAGRRAGAGPHQQESIAVSPATEATASAEPVPGLGTPAEDSGAGEEAQDEADGTCVRELEFDTTAHTAASDPSPAPKLADPRPAPLAQPRPVVHHNTPIDTAPAPTRTLSPKRTGSATDLAQGDAPTAPLPATAVAAPTEEAPEEVPDRAAPANDTDDDQAETPPATTGADPPAMLEPEMERAQVRSEPGQDQQPQDTSVEPTSGEESAYSAPPAGHTQPTPSPPATADNTTTTAAAAGDDDTPNVTAVVPAEVQEEEEEEEEKMPEPAPAPEPEPEPEPTPQELLAARWAKPLPEADIRGRVVRFYEKYNADRLSQVGEIVDRYGNDPPGLFGALRNKYGPEPGPVIMTRTTRPKSNAAKPDSPPPPAAAAVPSTRNEQQQQSTKAALPSPSSSSSSAVAPPAASSGVKVVKMPAAQRPPGAATTSASAAPSSASTTSASPTTVPSPTPSQPRTVASAGASTAPGRRLSAKERLAQFKISDSDADSSDDEE